MRGVVRAETDPRSFQGAAASSVQQQLERADAGVRQAIQAYQAIVTTLERAAQ